VRVNVRCEDKSEVVDNGSSRIGAGGERSAKATEAGDLGGRGGSPQEKLDPGNR
jgi:hypothetical protein